MKKLVFETKDFINKSNLDYGAGLVAKDIAQAQHDAFMKELMDV